MLRSSLSRNVILCLVMRLNAINLKHILRLIEINLFCPFPATQSVKTFKLLTKHLIKVCFPGLNK